MKPKFIIDGRELDLDVLGAEFKPENIRPILPYTYEQLYECWFPTEVDVSIPIPFGIEIDMEKLNGIEAKEICEGHDFVNVGFTTEKLVCKFCDEEKNDSQS